MQQVTTYLPPVAISARRSHGDAPSEPDLPDHIQGPARPPLTQGQVAEQVVLSTSETQHLMHHFAKLLR